MPANVPSSQGLLALRAPFAGRRPCGGTEHIKRNPPSALRAPGVKATLEWKAAGTEVMYHGDVVAADEVADDGLQSLDLQNNAEDILLGYADDIATRHPTLTNDKDSAQEVSHPVFLGSEAKEGYETQDTGLLHPVLQSPEVDEQDSSNNENNDGGEQLQGSGCVGLHVAGESLNLHVFSTFCENVCLHEVNEEECSQDHKAGLAELLRDMYVKADGNQVCQEQAQVENVKDSQSYTTPFGIPDPAILVRHWVGQKEQQEVHGKSEVVQLL